MWAATVSQVSAHQRSRSADPEAAWAASNMAAIAATLRAHAADSVRDHASTAPAPEVPAVKATMESNIHGAPRVFVGAFVLFRCGFRCRSVAFGVSAMK